MIKNSKLFLMVLTVLFMTAMLVTPAFAQDLEAPVLSSPKHGEVVTGETVELQWEAPAGADVYALYVWELTGGVVEVIAENELVFETSYTLDGLSDDGGVFAWTVAAAATGGESFSDYAIPIAFVNGSDKDVLPPTLTSPEHYSNVPGTEVALEWDAPDGGDTYVVMVWMYTEDEGYVPVVNNEPVHETSYQLDGLNDNGEQYAWTVVAGSTAAGKYYDYAFPWIFINGE